MNGLQFVIHSLAQALGLDPALLDNDIDGPEAGVENDNEHDDDMDGLLLAQGPVAYWEYDRR